jgi:hypothetical protein
VRFEKQGEWFVSTPIYIGMKDDVDKAARCPHGTWKEFGKGSRVEDGKKILACTERCTICVATRVRYKYED